MLSALVDNRNFINIEVNGETYRAFLDPGATLSLAGARIADRFKSVTGIINASTDGDG